MLHSIIFVKITSVVGFLLFVTLYPSESFGLGVYSRKLSQIRLASLRSPVRGQPSDSVVPPEMGVLSRLLSKVSAPKAGSLVGARWLPAPSKDTLAMAVEREGVREKQ